ncbi:HNH endonuclease [Halobacillus sp. KCTC 3957]|uniref:HNH endonuclease n=1 Tax=Halobacillus yeomjeoni TaxID=311194 RepID=A0A931HXP8_9BACI|nr:HNH endonuclease [Halobacillus yeomjeoni]MBH0231383.1 HNH endonuclease [Halobacillus yeomjeoni]
MLNKINNIKVAKNNNRRAPNKPLLILYALGQLTKGKRILSYKETHDPLRKLLLEYGPPVKHDVTTEDPFVRLKNDGIWEVTPNIDHSKYFSRKTLISQNVQGGFTKEILLLFEQSPSTINEIAEVILNNHFPETYHNELLERVGLNISIRKYRKRDSEFRRKVLEAYDFSCVVCGFSAQINDSIVGVEATHIKWHQAFGPDTETNGLALCSLHHQLFDKGIITITNNYSVKVSPKASGKGTFKLLVTDFHDKKIKTPACSIYLPDIEFINWHIREVYKQYSFT